MDERLGFRGAAARRSTTLRSPANPRLMPRVCSSGLAQRHKHPPVRRNMDFLRPVELGLARASGRRARTKNRILVIFKAKKGDHMHLVSEFDYRNAKAIINNINPMILHRITNVLTANDLNIQLQEGRSQRDLSKQVQSWFELAGWEKEVPPMSVPDMRYDLYDGGIPIEIEIGHKRLIYADFFEFMADYSNSNIQVAIMIVTNDSNTFGHNWHCDLVSTKNKINAIKNIYLVPTYIVGIDP